MVFLGGFCFRHATSVDFISLAISFVSRQISFTCAVLAVLAPCRLDLHFLFIYKKRFPLESRGRYGNYDKDAVTDPMEADSGN